MHIAKKQSICNAFHELTALIITQKSNYVNILNIVNCKICNT